jgi:hypothetical protein
VTATGGKRFLLAAERALLKPARRRLRDAYYERKLRRTKELAYPVPPVTFTDKVRYKMLNDRRLLLTQWADKVAVRDYVERKVGREYLTELYLVTEDPEQVRKEALPREFALKPSHGSGACVIVRDHSPAGSRLPDPTASWVQVRVAPDSLDWHSLVEMCRSWLAWRYRPAFEFAYRGVPPKIVAEELLLDGGSIPRDYKFFVFHGRVELVQVDSYRFVDHRRDLFRPDWEPLDVEYEYPRSGKNISRPASLGVMLRVAEALGQETDFVRVDLYDVAGRVVFGELTNYPGGGIEIFVPPSFDEELGRCWTVPSRYY